jgi:hypothetical protein
LTGYIQPHALDELWFHTGTACNLACPFCLEGSKPGDGRLDRITLDDARPLIDEALGLDVRQLSFTGGEPFIVKDFVDILAYAAARRPCLVLTNATDPVLRRLPEIDRLCTTANTVSFRVSIDYPDARRHDEGRGQGNFDKALEGMRELRRRGFDISVARQMDADEDSPTVEARYRRLFRESDLPPDLRLVPFPDFGIPGAAGETPEITEDCMTRHHTEATRRAFMCAFSKMVVKIDGRMRVYACTLVDDDPSYDLGGTLAGAMNETITLHHQRCYACFKLGSSCSQL